MKPHVQIVVTIDPNNNVSATIRIHDGDAPTFDEGRRISDNTVSSHFQITHYPHFSKAPHSFEVAAVASAAEYLAEVVAANPLVRTEDDATGRSALPPALAAE